MSVNERLADAAVSHAVDLAQYGNGVTRRMLRLLGRVDADLMRQIESALERLPADSFTVQRLEGQLSAVRALNRQAYEAVGMALPNELRDLTAYEAGYQRQLFASAVPTQVTAAVGLHGVDVGQVYSAALSRPFAISKAGAVPMAEYLSRLETGRAQSIRDAIRIGYLENEPIAQIVRRIRGTRAMNYTDGLMEASRRHVEGMVRTAVNHTANFTRQSFYEANSDLVRGWTFSATLDSRTSITCASLDGKEYPVGKGPLPPRHINCRSVSIPVVASWRELGLDVDEFSPADRASMDGTVPADISFSAWLRTKPASLQDDVLGVQRARLFRANKIEIDRFTDNKGRVIDLDSLRKKDALLFEKAGIAA